MEKYNETMIIRDGKVVQNHLIFPSIRCDNIFLKEVIAAPQFSVFESG